MRHALPYGIATKFGKDVRHGYIVLFAGFFNVTYNFIDHELVIVLKTQRVFNWEASADIDRIQFRTYFLKLAIQVYHLVKLTPVVDIILYPFVKEDVKHLQLKAIFIALNFVDVKFQYIPGPETQAGSIEW